MVDYNLANQSGAQFRAELNLILAALQSSAYGTTAPATTTAGQVWVDASGASPVLNVRNALNNGWIAIGTLASGGFELAGPAKAALAGAAFTGPVSSTAGALNTVAVVALGNVAATLTAAQLTASKIFTITPTAARILTTDTAVNIIAALGGFDAAFAKNVAFTVINTAAFDVTLAPGAGVTIIGKAIVKDGSGTWRIRIDSASAVTISAEASSHDFRELLNILTPGATVTPNLDRKWRHTLTLNQATTIANPSGMPASGQSVMIVLKQDATGGRLVAWGSSWKFPSAFVPVLSTAANSIDVVIGEVISPTEIICNTIMKFG